MAKRTIAEEIINALAQGAVAQPDNKFLDEDGQPIKVRSMENTSDPLEAGDILHIPVDYKVILAKFHDDDAKAHPYIYCEVTAEDGSSRNFRFFPNSLCKSVTPIVDGKRQARVKTRGTATDLYRTVETVDEGLALLRGKSIKVVTSESHTIKDWSTKALRDTHIYQYDLVP